MNRRLLILLDKTAFRVLFYLAVFVSWFRRSPKAEDPVDLGESPSLLVIRPGGLGDGIMTVPVLRALRRTFPNGRITLLCVKKNRAALEHLPVFDDLMVFDSPRHLLKNAIRLRKSKFDAVFDMEPFRRVSAVVGFYTGARIRTGFDTNSRRRLYTHLVSYANDHRFESSNMARQLTVVGVRVPDEEAHDLRFELPEAPRERAAEILLSHDLDPERDFVVAVAPGVLKPHHRWIMSEFAKLIDSIRRQDRKARVLLVGGPRDRRDTEKVLGHLSEREGVVDLVGTTTFLESLGLLRSSRILVACDGGVVYMAAAMGCATISLWGPGVMERFKPPGPRHVGVRKDYSCVPCVTWDRLGEFPPCPYARRCYNDITADEVFEAYSQLKESAAAAR